MRDPLAVVPLLAVLAIGCAPPEQTATTIVEPAVQDGPPVLAVSAEKLDVLDYRLGKWALLITLHQPGQPPQEIHATSTHERILGGDYLLDTTEWGTPEHPVRGVGNTAYDTIGQRYVHTWSDGSSAMTSLYGTYDAATGTITYAGEKIDFGLQDVVTTRWVERSIDEDHWIAKAYSIGPDGQEVLATECAYSRIR